MSLVSKYINVTKEIETIYNYPTKTHFLHPVLLWQFSSHFTYLSNLDCYDIYIYSRMLLFSVPDRSHVKAPGICTMWTIVISNLINKIQ